MNPLDENAFLFSGGSFALWQGDETGNYSIIKPGDWGVHSGGVVYIFSEPSEPRVTVAYPSLGQLKLIARPIEDMTQDELEKHSEYSPDYLYNNAGSLPLWQSLELLKIGVYPFDQSHFDDGTVIDIRTIDS